MDAKPVRTRYPLSRRLPLFVRIFAVAFIAAAFYDPVTELVKTGQTQAAKFLPLLLALPFAAFVVRFTNTYLELTDDALLIRRLFTERIPYRRIQSVELPAPGERIEWTDYISASGRGWGKGWIESWRGNILVLTIGKSKTAIVFGDADATPAFEDLRKRLDQRP